MENGCQLGACRQELVSLSKKCAKAENESRKAEHQLELQEESYIMLASEDSPAARSKEWALDGQGFAAMPEPEEGRAERTKEKRVKKKKEKKKKEPAAGKKDMSVREWAESGGADLKLREWMELGGAEYEDGFPPADDFELLDVPPLHDMMEPSPAQGLATQSQLELGRYCELQYKWPSFFGFFPLKMIMENCP